MFPECGINNSLIVFGLLSSFLNTTVGDLLLISKDPLLKHIPYST